MVGSPTEWLDFRPQTPQEKSTKIIYWDEFSNEEAITSGDFVIDWKKHENILGCPPSQDAIVENEGLG